MRTAKLHRAGRDAINRQAELSGVMPAMHWEVGHLRSQEQRLDQIQDNLGRDRLASLAVRLVQEEFGITDKDLLFDSKLVAPKDMSPIGVRQPNLQGLTRDVLDPLLEKRGIANKIIQGCAHTVQYRFLFEAHRIESEYPELVTASRKLIALTDLQMLHLPQPPPEFFDAAPPHGRVELLRTVPLTVKARAIHFPVLVHELAKGVIECLALHGLPEDQALREAVLALRDQPCYERDDLVQGGPLWKLIIKALPPGDTRQRNLFLRSLFRADPAALKSSMERLLDGDEEGVKRLLGN